MPIRVRMYVGANRSVGRFFGGGAGCRWGDDVSFECREAKQFIPNQIPSEGEVQDA